MAYAGRTNKKCKAGGGHQYSSWQQPGALRRKTPVSVKSSIIKVTEQPTFDTSIIKNGYVQTNVIQEVTSNGHSVI